MWLWCQQYSKGNFYSFEIWSWFLSFWLVYYSFPLRFQYIVTVLHRIRSAFVLDNARHWGRSLDLETTKLLWGQLSHVLCEKGKRKGTSKCRARFISKPPFSVISKKTKNLPESGTREAWPFNYLTQHAAGTHYQVSFVLLFLQTWLICDLQRLTLAPSAI